MDNKTSEFEELKTLLNQAPCGIGLFDIESSEPLLLNDAYYNIIGYSREEYKAIIHNYIEALVFPSDRDTTDKSESDFWSSGKASDYEYRVTRKDGSVVWVKTNISTVVLYEKKYALATFVDITNEKEAYLQLNMITENVDSSISLLKICGNHEHLIYANARFYDLMGVAPEEYKKNADELNKLVVSREDHERIRQAVNKALKTGKPGEVEHRLLRTDGKTLWLRRRYAAIPQDVAGSYLLVSVATDITEQKELQIVEELERHRYQLVIDELNAAVFEWDFKTGEFYRSPAYCNYAMSKVSNKDILSNNGPMDVVHPDDLPILMQFFKDTQSGQSRVEATLRIKLMSGAFHWCKMLGYYFKDKQGNPSRTVGVILDINTDRERELMINGLLNEMPGGVAVLKRVNSGLECQYFSDGFAKMSGRSREEVEELTRKGLLIETVISPSDRHLITEILAQINYSNDSVNKVFRCVTKDGTSKWLHLAATKIREEDGCPVFYCIFTVSSDETSHFRSVVEDSAIGVLIAEKSTRRVIYMNTALYDIYGISTSAVNAESRFTDVVDNKKLLLTQSEVEALKDDAYTEFHRTYGRNLYLSIRGRSLAWNGIDAYILYVTDESEEHERQLRLQELVDHIPGGIGIFELYNNEAHQIYLNNSFYELIYDRRENRIYERDTDFFKNVHHDDYPVLQTAIAELSAGKKSVAFNYRTKTKRGNYTWLHLTARAIAKVKGKTTIYCCFTDINEAMAAKDALEKTNTLIQAQYHQEFERRKVLEKGSFVNICINITKKMVVSLNCIDDRFKNLPPEFDCDTAVEIMLETIPAKEDKENVKKIMNCDYAMELFSQGITEGSVEYRSYQPDGRLHWIRVVCYIIEDIQSSEIISYAYYYNIDDEKKVRLTLNCVIDEEIDYVMLYSVFTDESRFMHVNHDKLEPSLRNDFTLSDVRSSVSYQSIIEEDREAADKFFNKNNLLISLKKAPVVTVTLRKLGDDGQIRRKKLRAFYLDETQYDIVIIRQDITDLYEEEQQQKRILREAADEAIRANRAKSEFLARMSHDMRTPMNGILGIAELIKGENDLNEINKDIAQLELSGQYLLRLINDTLDMNKIETGKLVLHNEVVNSEQLFKNVLANATLLAREKSIELKVDAPHIATGKWVPVVTDPTRLEQIVMNVISNAIKFTQPGGTVTLEMETVSITKDTVTDRYTVRDTGIGMSEEFLPHLFESFSQEGRMNTERENGTGLGMSIVKQLVEMMGGEISVKSKINEGTEISILMHYLAYRGENTKKPEHESDFNILNGKRVLLCEDHPLNARIAMQLLEKEGMQVEHASNGQEGSIMYAVSTPFYYDAVLMDIRMPVMNGLEAAAAIRSLARPDAKEVPIIAMTANAYEEDVEKSLSAGMNVHLAKPVHPTLLFETLCEQIEKYEDKKLSNNEPATV